MDLPEMHSVWEIVGQQYKLMIVDWWSTGIGDTYKRTMYELRYAHTKRKQYLAADRLHQLIEEGKIKLINN